MPDKVIDELLRVNPADLPPISQNMSYDALSKAILGPELQRPSSCYFLTSPFNSSAAAPTLVTRITLVSDPEDATRFALIFSISHVAVDGESYYGVINKQQESAERMIEAQGREDCDY